ncbi:hypothetical protein BU17DRAFT_65370 [Hysterangium stoloniferum]|nr:hypothetical protein BU17DRAFT_65370 [Hysterangium stoloniferum]
MHSLPTSRPHTQITHLPFEVVEAILFCCSPVTVSAFAQTCKAYRRLVYHPEDSHFWRTLFLRQAEFDDPRLSQTDPVNAKVHWDAMLQRWVAASNKLRSASLRVEQDQEFLYAVNEMIAHARPSPSPSSNLQTLQRLFDGNDHMSQFEDDSSTVRNIITSPGQTKIQLAYRLRVYFGYGAAIRVAQERPRARYFVYNLRHYHHRNDYGPFLPDGSGCVNWGHIFMIQLVITMNVMSIASPEQLGLLMNLTSLQPRSPADCGVTDKRDWAGITGKWQVIFCSCDHREVANGSEPDLAIFEDEEFEGVARCLDFNLCVTRVEQCPGKKDRPKIHFVGEVKGISRIAGQVYMSPDNQIRWSFVLEEPAVQIGGVGSACGALGTWTTIFHDVDDPVGPMWLYKHSI